MWNDGSSRSCRARTRGSAPRSATALRFSTSKAGRPKIRRVIGQGISTLQNVTYADDAGVSAQQALLQVNDSENGLFFCDGNGDAVFVGRHQLIQEAGFTTSVATFGDAAAVAS